MDVQVDEPGKDRGVPERSRATGAPRPRRGADRDDPVTRDRDSRIGDHPLAVEEPVGGHEPIHLGRRRGRGRCTDEDHDQNGD